MTDLVCLAWASWFVLIVYSGGLFCSVFVDFIGLMLCGFLGLMVFALECFGGLYCLFVCYITD